MIQFGQVLHYLLAALNIGKHHLDGLIMKSVVRNSLKLTLELQENILRILLDEILVVLLITFIINSENILNFFLKRFGMPRRRTPASPDPRAGSRYRPSPS